MRSLFILTLLVPTVFGVGGIRKFLTPIVANSSSYETKFFDAYINNFDPTLGDKFSVKYLVNTDFFTSDGTGPLFFYTGNEGTIETFANNTGIIYDIAPEFKALIVFCEHRYYGNGSSMPFGDDSFNNTDNARYLTIEQTLEDFVHLIRNLREEYNFTKVIAFGGSYGGMLSAWFRAKYPKVVDGAWAASAPVAYFRKSLVAMGSFDSIVTKTMTRFGCNKDAVTDAIKQLHNCTPDFLNEVFNVNSSSLIKNDNDIDNLKGYIREGFEYMAMTCYPYPANFLRPLGPWPMLSACQNLSTSFSTPEDGARALKQAMDSFYDPNKTACFLPGCGDSATAGLGDLYGWSWQSCTEIAIDICAEGPPVDPFWTDCTRTNVTDNVPTFEDFFANSCSSLNQTILGYDTKMIQYDFIKDRYGFDLEGATNLILTQGKLDPWSAGDALIEFPETLDRNIYKYSIDGAAHHLDLRVPNTCDPPTVTSARYQIVNILKCWTGLKTEGCDPRSLQWELPKWDGPVMRDDCADLIQQYPWGLPSSGSTSVSPKPVSPTGSTVSSASKGTATTQNSQSTTSVSPKPVNPTGSTVSSPPKGTATTQNSQSTTSGVNSKSIGVFSLLILNFLSIMFFNFD